MSQFVEVFHRIVREEEGQDLVEYALLVGLIALIAAVGVGLFGGAVNTGFSNLSTTVAGWLP